MCTGSTKRKIKEALREFKEKNDDVSKINRTVSNLEVMQTYVYKSSAPLSLRTRDKFCRRTGLVRGSPSDTVVIC